jgi:hypothetical protein
MSGEGVAGYTPSASALPTLAQLRSRVYAPLRDSERSFVEPWFVDQLLNEAYLDLCARLRLYEKTATGTVAAAGIITYPTDLVEVKNLWLATATLPVQFVDADTFLAWANPATDAPYRDIARVTGATFETYPSAEGIDYTLEYVARPTEMVAESDTPALLTIELVPRIVNYARAYAKWQEGESQEGDKFMALFEQGLPGAPREAWRRNPGPFTMIPEAGPFDAQEW